MPAIANDLKIDGRILRFARHPRSGRLVQKNTKTLLLKMLLRTKRNKDESLEKLLFCGTVVGDVCAREHGRHCRGSGRGYVVKRLDEDMNDRRRGDSVPPRGNESFCTGILSLGPVARAEAWNMSGLYCARVVYYEQTYNVECLHV